MVNYQFRGGAHVNFVSRKEVLLSVQQVKPKLVILEVGTNDLSLGACDPVRLAHTVYKQADRLIREYGVQRVLICEVLHRLEGEQFRHGAPYAGFNSHVDRYNAHVRKLVEQQNQPGKIIYVWI